MSIIYTLLMGNSLDSCIEDIKLMEDILNKLYNSTPKYIIKPCFNCYPQRELIIFLNKYSHLFKKEDTLYIHYSGHGEVVGKRINNKLEMISTWVNPDNTHTYSNIIDKIWSRVNCQIILVSDSCHSGEFGKFYTGDAPYLFIGSSSIIDRSYEYIIYHSKKTGCLVGLFEYIIKNKSIDLFNGNPIDIKQLKSITRNFFKRNKIKVKPIIKYMR